jgi:hypothetical protein
MPVLEVTQLRLRGISTEDPKLLHSLSDARERLQTKSQFYVCIEDPTKMYILGIWRDLKQHLDFLASPARGEILGPQEDILEFEWTVHMDVESMSSLALDAPILALERLSVGESSVKALDPAVMSYVQQLRGSHPFTVTYGWRCDAAPGSYEAIIFSGWEIPQAHVPFAARQQRHGNGDHATIIGQYEDILVHHAWNLERKRA